MAGVLEKVNLRTQMAGQNRLELLLFKLNNSQSYGINVFKIREIIKAMRVNIIPQSHEVIYGVAHIRDKTVPIIDLSMAIDKKPLPDLESSYVIITEYNQSVQGFLVSNVDKIVNLKWEEILPPPPGVTANNGSYLTAVTKVDEKLVQVIDVEKVLQEINPSFTDVSEKCKDLGLLNNLTEHLILIADDSSVARNQLKKTLSYSDVKLEIKNDGKQMLDFLKNLAENDVPRLKNILMLISDVEMPEMDGYTLTTAIRNDPRLSHIYIVLHTSLSGIFNKALVKKVGADQFMPKFNAESIIDLLKERIDILQGGKD